MKLGGIDVGTTGCKLTVYNEKGEFLHKSYVEYEVTRTTGEHEIDGTAIWNGVKALIKETAETVGNIDAIGVTTFGETFVMLDADDNVLLESMLYTDPRGTEEAASFDEELVMNIAGVKPHAMYSLPKIMWIKKNKNEIYEKAEKILLFEDYIVYMLTGNNQIDYSLAARTMGLDIRTCTWSRELFEFAGIDMDKMSNPVPAGTPAGRVRTSLAYELGLKGTISNTPCENASHWIEEEKIHIKLIVRDAALFAHQLILEREYICPINENVIYMTDTIRNIGSKESPLEVLYHCNMGYPLLTEDSVVTVPSSEVTPRNEHSAEDIDNCLNMEKPQPDYEERCYYHKLTGDTCVSINNPNIGKGLNMKFDADELKYFTEWKMMGEHEYVLGLEPGNCTPDGRDVMRRKGELRILKPGETEVYHLTFEFTEDNKC